MKKFLGLAWRGMAMGIAEVIPGVSGGTLAFITGIYEELIATIKQVLSPAPIQGLRQGGLAGFWQAINGPFLLALLVGMFVGIVVGVFGVTYLLETYPLPLWGFFFGLIAASVWYIGRQVSWSLWPAIAMLAAAGIAYYITVAAPASGFPATWWVFLCGAIAISALLLPGVSGSFILLLLGMYTYIIPTVKKFLSTFDPALLVTLSAFGLGCLAGLAVFSRVLTWAFKNYKNMTLATLTGFMLGSLNRVWPWREVLSTRVDSSGEVVPFLERSVLPANYSGSTELVPVIITMISGAALVVLLSRLEAPASDSGH